MFLRAPWKTNTSNTGAVRSARRLGTHDIFLNLTQRMHHDVLRLSVKLGIDINRLGWGGIVV